LAPASASVAKPSFVSFGENPSNKRGSRQPSSCRIASVEGHLSNVDGATAINPPENLSLNNAELKRLDDIYGLLQWSLESRAKSPLPKRAKR
jgi:hypothetical protein